MFSWKKLSNLFLVVLFFLACLPHLSAEARQLRFRAAIETVLRESEELHAQRATIKTRREQVNNAIRNYFPDLSLDMQFFEANKYGALRRSEDPYTESSVDLVQPVWSGGRLSGVYTQNSAGLNSAQSKYYVLAQEKMNQAADHYLKLLKLRMKIERKQNLRVQAEEALEITTRRYEMGSANRKNVLDVRQRLNDINSDIVKSRHNHAAARYKMNQMLGRGVEAPLQVRRGRFEVKDTVPESVASSKVERDVQLMLKNSPEIQRLKSEMKYYEQGVRLARANYLPEINFEANYTSGGENIFGTEETEEYYLGFNMKMFIFGHSFDVGARQHDSVGEVELENEPNQDIESQNKYNATLRFFDNSPDIISAPIDSRQSVENVGSLDIQTQQAEKRLEDARIKYERSRDEKIAEFRKNYNALSKARHEIKYNLESLEFHDENVKIMRQKFETGTTKIIDFLEALTERENSRIELIESWYNYYLNRFRIDLKTGRISPAVDL